MEWCPAPARVQDIEPLVARQGIHARARSEVIGILRAAVQYHHKRQRRPSNTRRHEELVVAGERGVRVHAADELALTRTPRARCIGEVRCRCWAGFEAIDHFEHTAFEHDRAIL